MYFLTHLIHIRLPTSSLLFQGGGLLRAYKAGELELLLFQKIGSEAGVDDDVGEEQQCYTDDK